MKEKEYLKKIVGIVKSMEDVTKTGRETPFNSTELRLLKELLMADMEGKKMISVQLAKRLGVTRSSVSQMVNRLEKDGMVYRLADDVDRKIAYIMMTDEAKELTKKELANWTSGLEEVVAQFGEENMDNMLSLLERFIEISNKVKQNEGK